MSNLLQKDFLYIFERTSHLVQGFNGKKILLTGGTGFIGKWFLEYFLFLNEVKNIHFSVIVISRNPEVFLEKYNWFKVSFIHFFKGDIVDFDYSSLPHCDMIIHAAADADAKLNYEQPVKIINTIVEGTKRVLDFAVKTKTTKILFLSSGAVYGVQPDNIPGFPEDFTGGPDILLPSSAYSESKRMAEITCICYQKQYNLSLNIARCFAFVGPYLPLDKHFAIGNFISNGLKGEDIIIRGNGIPLRSYMYSADMIIWLLYILFNGKNGIAYNVGSEKSITIKELALKVSLSFPGLRVKVLGQVNATDRNQNYIPDTSKARIELIVPAILSLEESIQRTIKFYLGNE